MWIVMNYMYELLFIDSINVDGDARTMNTLDKHNAFIVINITFKSNVCIRIVIPIMP